jgi:hypothetical protein
MSESQPETPGKHAAPDDDPNSDPPPAAGEGGEHAAEDATDEGDKEGDEEPELEEDSGGGTRQPGADPADAEQIEKERKERLDPDNRPDGVEVDNTDRDFDAEKGMFTDAEGYDEAEEKFPAIGEQGA